MKTLILYASLLLSLQTIAQPEAEKAFLAIDTTGNKDSTVNYLATKRFFSVDNAKLLRFNLLDKIQEEFCFWSEPACKIETQKEVIDKIKAYWAVINVYPTSKEITTYSWQEKHPWSAAFISWCMKNAGYDDLFKYAPNHAEYIVWAKQNRLKKDSTNPFWAYTTTDSAAAWPKAGDLLCKNRSGKKFTLYSIEEKCISHCDVVLEVDKANGIITTIGGNVLDKVNKRWVFLNKDGFIDNTANWLCFDANGVAVSGAQKEFFAVIKVF